jgi:ATP-binding cassette subfamily C protein CydCD
LLADQPILVLDEPTEGLDRPTAMALVADLLDTASDRAVLMLTHRDEGLDLVDRSYRLVDGRLVASRDTRLPGYLGLAAPSGLAEVIQPG